MDTDTKKEDLSVILSETQYKGKSDEESENNVLLPKVEQKGCTNTANVNSREFVEEIDDILSTTNNLIIKLSENPSTNEPFKSSGVTSVFHVFNGAGVHIFTIGRCPVQQNIQSFVISNSAGHGLMNFTTNGILNRVCDIDGAGLLSFTQIQHIHGGYTLRDPYKELVKIRCSWIPFCTCCLVGPVSSATMTFTDLDGTTTGSITFKNELNRGCSDSNLCLNFIPNLNPKAKYMLFAASLRLLCTYFSESGRRHHSRCLILCYLLFVVILFIVFLIVINIFTRYFLFSMTLMRRGNHFFFLGKG